MIMWYVHHIHTYLRMWSISFTLDILGNRLLGKSEERVQIIKFWWIGTP